MPDRRARGRRAEALAAAWLEERGFRILLQNVHVRHAELDLLALEGRTLCFIEVRQRSSPRMGTAGESVDARKQRRIYRAAREIVATRRLPRHDAMRFDVVTVDAGRVELIRDAFFVS